MNPGAFVTWVDEEGPRLGHVVRVLESVAIVSRRGIQIRIPLVALRQLREGPRVVAEDGQAQLEHLPAARR